MAMPRWSARQPSSDSLRVASDCSPREAPEPGHAASALGRDVSARVSWCAATGCTGWLGQSGPPVRAKSSEMTDPMITLAGAIGLFIFARGSGVASKLDKA